VTKFDLLLARIQALPPERQEAMAVHLDILLGQEESGSYFTDEEWAVIEQTLDEDDEEIPHETVAARIRAKFPG
jgi:hypothetical protein